MISETTRQAIDLFIRILFITGYVAGPIIIIILVMYAYERYKKWKDAKTREAERVIVKMNEEIVKTGNSINVLTAAETTLKLEIQALEARRKELKEESGEDASDDQETTEQAVNPELNIKQLHALARERKIKGFSRMKKEDLIKILGQ